MLRRGLFLALLLASAVSVPQPSRAGGALYGTADAAQSTCPGEEVVWLDFFHTRYNHKAQPSYGKGDGSYTCLHTARANGYKESKQEPEQAASSN
jgi:hypothetical protein